MSENRLLRIRLSLKGRPIRSYTFNQDCVLVGRDPEADVHLDNPGVSRTHVKIERTAEGYVAEDQNSSNGTFLNDQPIRRQLLRNEDVLRVGKFSLWLNTEDDRRGTGRDAQVVAATPGGATTVLSITELDKLLRVVRAAEPTPLHPEPSSEIPAQTPPRARQTPAVVTVGLLLAFVLGTVVGIGAMWYMNR